MSSSDAGSKPAPNKPSVRSRMTSLVRRSSTALSFTRPGASSRRSSSESLTVDTHQTLAPPEIALGHKIPSPVLESPVVAPAPIASPTPVQPDYRPPSAPIDIPIKTPPPHNNWGDGPITITPSSIASPVVIARSEGAEILLAADDGRSSHPESPARNEDELSMDGLPGEVGIQSIPAPVHVIPHPDEGSEAKSTREEPGLATPSVPPKNTSFVPGVSVSEHELALKGDGSDSTGTSLGPSAPPEVSALDFAYSGASHDATIARSDQLVFDISAMEGQHLTSINDDVESGRSRGSTVSSQDRPLTPPAMFTQASTSAKTSIAPSAENIAPIVILDRPADGATSTSSIRLYDDPFADPAPVAETTTRAYSPDRAAFQSPMDSRPSDRQSAHSIPLSVPMPQPAILAPVGVQGGSHWNDPTGPKYVDDEHIPLVRGSSQTPSETTDFPRLMPDYGAAPSVDLTFERLGWLMHVLPDTTVYFTHPGLRIVTDIDLRLEGAMRDVSRYLGGPRVRPPAGWELWLRSAGIIPVRAPEHSFVHHENRIVVPVSYEPEAIEPSVEEMITLQAIYWRYIEKHPAHLVLSPTTSAEATDILTWAYTDRLLPPEARERIPPFSQDECHELSSILRSLDANPSPNHMAIRTRVIAKIMLRVCRWKQGQVSTREYESAPHSLSNVQPSFVRRAADVAMSIACLGIPYLFVDRSRSRREYHENGMRSAAGSMLVVGAVACVIAAVVLGASVTLISIPGLNDISRIASCISIILSASSLVSALLALLRWKTDVERNVYSGIGQEGFMVMTTRSVLLSLPLVFLIWAIAAFVIGVALHMLRGLVLPRHVGRYMQWVVVGTFGGLAGMLFACGLLIL
ncbi:unnamed protein product [Peniophora sp. CBMAI 1063]|nr:unnamed protein product [Peniophora sp. CBMAI 1063]